LTTRPRIAHGLVPLRAWPTTRNTSVKFRFAMRGWNHDSDVASIVVSPPTSVIGLPNPTRCV
jgi:hypothetical protein